jgi:hypothetical protein
MLSPNQPWSRWSRPRNDPKLAMNGSMRLFPHLFDYAPEPEHLYHNYELHASAFGVAMLYARCAWSVFTLLGAFLKCKIDKPFALRATDACFFDARGFVIAAYCGLFSTVTTKKRWQSPKKHQSERDIVEDELRIASIYSSVPNICFQHLISRTIWMLCPRFRTHPCLVAQGAAQSCRDAVQRT